MSITGDTAREMARSLIDRYFRTNLYPYTKHHIDSYDQFLKTDLISTFKAQNPFIILKDIIDESRNLYKYKIEIFIGGENGDKLEIGTPTVNLQNGKDIRLLFPNEARLRNLTYAASVYADIDVHITYTADKTIPTSTPEIVNLTGIELFKIPIMLHSSYCLLHNKPKEFLRVAGECTQDNGGYFIVDGSEKILVTQQEQAFNTLYITKQKSSTKPNYIYATIACLNQQSRTTKRIAFGISRKTEDHNCIVVSLPMVRKAIPLFILFRALGFQSDKEIIQCIFPDIESAEAKLLMPYLYESIKQAESVYNTNLAIQYIKIFTKGFSEIHVLDIIRNQLFIHMPNDTTRQALFLGDCVRRIIRVHAGFDEPTDRDDTQNQRCHVSGFLIQMLFNNIYSNWKKKVSYAIDLEYNKNVSIYDNNQFKNMFMPEKISSIFALEYMTESIMRGFKGKWAVGYGEEKAGVLQQLSRLSYCDFMSHCRRLTLDTGGDTEIIGPHKLHPSQYGYFCTNETPSGKSIGITKNLTIMATFSIHSDATPLMNWLKTRGRVYDPEILNIDQKIAYVPLYINNGLFGYTAKPQLIVKVLKAFKRAGCISYSTSITFSVKKRRVQIFVDQGRPLRPLIHLEDAKIPVDKIKSLRTWRDLVMGTLPERAGADLSSTEFIDPFAADNIQLEEYYDKLLPYTGALEYIDPYEQNESYIANYPEYITPETTHMEIHPSTILSLMTGVIPFPHHNQSPRNQLSCSQSKQGLSIYATNWKNRFDNNTHVLCYGEAPLSRSLYSNYLGEGKMPYGMNCVLAIACWSGYNQEDGIVMNKDAVERGMFRNITYRSYEAFEEDDKMTRTKKRFANPAKVQNWKDLKPGLDYSKLDAYGVIREGEIIDENTVIIGAFTTTESGQIIDSSITPQVWTTGRVDKVVQMVSNQGLRLIKIRAVQDRIPELGDKFCLTPDHEVLTERGWINIDNVTSEDKVCTLNDGKIEYSIPSNFYKFTCNDEELYHISSQQVDLLTTLNHKMYIKRRNKNNYELIEAEKIIGKRVQYKKDGINNNTDYQLELPFNNHHSAINVNLNMSLFLEFFGYWMSDGWVSTIKHDNGNTLENRIELSLGREHDIQRVKALLTNMGYNPSINGTRVILYNKQLADYLQQFSLGAINKRLPDWVWKLSQGQCRILLSGLIAGDGTVMKNGVERFFTSSTGLADDFQRLCLHAGWSANKAKIQDAGTEIVICGRKTKSNADYWGLTINKHKNNPMVNHGHTKTQKVQIEEKVKYTGNVYCIEVPSHIFYVRRNGKAVWTGNSNRHGQKGTIGALLRGHDMPRTADGIVPDMIMNPHAIPSRMTIGQNLEQLLGKAAAAAGAIGDATAFMNDGSPEEYIGALLEARGFEKYGNEIMYNGATGEQLMGSIFVGPVYGMRLKHMVQDKIQARGKGRKEQKTHQPTGGRSNQGGLKIGEMDRDAIASYGIASFFRESFMDRSDGAKFPICTGCGTFPIYNPKLGIAICSLCDGPVKFAGDTIHNMEILPPLSKPKSKIVEVEMPYATKLLNNELETYLNMGLRYITTSGVQRLRPFELTAEGTAAIRELRPLELPDTFVPEYIEKDPAENVSTDELAALQVRMTSLAEEQPTIIQEREGEPEGEGIFMGEGVIPSGIPPINETITPGLPPLGEEGEMEGGYTSLDAAPLDTAFTSPLPSGPNIIAVDTSPFAMADEGLTNPFGGYPAMGGRRTLRRAPAFGGQRQQMYGGESTTDPETGAPIVLRKTAPVTVNKLG